MASGRPVDSQGSYPDGTRDCFFPEPARTCSCGGASDGRRTHGLRLHAQRRERGPAQPNVFLPRGPYLTHVPAS
eukprot:3347277-Pyramimonas_sp.AAC.1